MAIPITGIPTFFTPDSYITAYATVVHTADRSEGADPVPVVADRQAVGLVLAAVVVGFPLEAAVVAEASGDVHARCATLAHLARDKHASRHAIASWNGL